MWHRSQVFSLPGRLVCAFVLSLALLGHVSAASFRFAWLSDTHVGSFTGEEDLRASVKAINSLTGLSFVVLSGDVTEYGSREQFRLAKELLDGLKVPYHIIPGNHDTKWSESGGTDFAKFWKADRFLFEHGGLRFVGLHQGPLMKMGDGHWAPQDIRWLAQTLDTQKDKDKPLVFITHYPIDDGIANWYVALEVLKQHNLQAILSGHVHRNTKAMFEGVPGATGRANVRGTSVTGGFTVVDVDGSSMHFTEHVIGEPPKPPWHSMVLEKHDYKNGTNRYPRPDFSVNNRYPNVKPEWEFKTGYTIASSPAIWNDLAVVGDASGTVYALSWSSGKKSWAFKTGGPVYSTPEVSGEVVVVASTDGAIYGIRAKTGKEQWKFQTQRPIVASPRAAGSLVYIGSSEGKFRALDLASGKLRWEFNGVGGFVETKPTIYDGKVFFGAWDQFLYALDANSSKLVWKWRGDRSGTLFSPAACWPVATENKVFIVAPDRKMTALDARSGEQIWRTGAYAVRESIGLSHDQSRFYVRAIQDFIFAFGTKSPRPEKLWEVNAGFGYDINSGMLVEKDDTVFYGTKNGLVIALSARDGAIKWQHKIGVGVVNTVVPLNGERVLATDFDGKIVLLNVRRPAS